MPKLDPYIREHSDPQFVGMHDMTGGDERPDLCDIGVENAREVYKANLTIEADNENTTSQLLTAPSRDGSYQIPLKMWHPTREAPKEGWPLFYHIHGGGWVIGGIYSEENHMSVWSNRAQCVVVTVDYRLAPEHRYPTGHHDVIDTYKWICDNAKQFNIDSSKIAVGGSSAGGSMAASLCHEAIKHGFTQPIYQVLIVPSLDASDNSKLEPELFNAAMLPAKLMDWFMGHYVPKDDPDAKEKLAQPLLSPINNSAESFAKLPPAAFFVGSVDLLRSQARSYSQKMIANGATVDFYKEYQGANHTFISFSGVLDQGKQGVEDISTHLHAALYPTSAKL